MTRTCTQCGEKFEKADVPKEYLYNDNLCSRGCSKKNQREYYEEKKNSGKCPRCGEPALEDSVCCKECLEKEKERRDRYKREGKCLRCGKPALEDSVHCQECLEKNKERKDRYKREGKCPICGEPALEDSVSCKECLEKMKERRDRYKREGKCPRCGKPALENSVYCQECLEKMKERRDRYKREGKCPICGDELPTDGRNWDGVLCPECQEKYRNDKFYGEFATGAEIRNGLHTDMVGNKLDLED